jgi:hypothetical protein
MNVCVVRPCPSGHDYRMFRKCGECVYRARQRPYAEVGGCGRTALSLGLVNGSSQQPALPLVMTPFRLEQTRSSQRKVLHFSVPSEVFWPSIRLHVHRGPYVSHSFPLLR